MRSFFLDETIFGENNNYIGYGLIIAENNYKTIVNEALYNLENDPDIKKPNFKKKDERTLQENYFHASEDSDNAHSSLSNSINKYLKGNFYYSFFDKYKNNYNDNFLLTLSSTSLLFNIFKSKEPVEIIYEQRNELTKEKLHKWITNYRDFIICSIFDRPLIKYYFPEYIIKTETKLNEGLQIADYILWTVGRKINNNKEKYEWLIKGEFEFAPTNREWISGELIFKNGLNRVNFDFYNIGNMNLDKEIDLIRLLSFFTKLTPQ